MPTAPSPDAASSPETPLQLNALLEEYKALYALALFRMTALDRRVPVAGGTLAATLASLTILPPEAQTIVFIFMPLALIWLVRTTINHVCSFEDALRRIEEIEREANRLLGVRLLCFQSRHPSRGDHVGGRTGTETIATVLFTCTMLLVAGVYLHWRSAAGPLDRFAYILFALGVLAYLAHCAVNLTRYRYRKSRPPPG